MKKVAYLGPEGTFSEEAGIQYSRKLGRVELIPYSTTHDLMYAVDRGKVDEGLTPIENSVEGSVGIVLDMLAREVNLKIKREIILPVYHYLIAPAGAKISEVTDIISHPQAIAQCGKFIRRHLPRARLHLAYSTAEAVRQVALGDERRAIHLTSSRQVMAAIGTRTAARLYRLKILASNINDFSDNLTRFVVLDKTDHAPTGDDKTSIVFSVRRDRPGALCDVLEDFAVRHINLTKVESRPSKKTLGDYFFFLDMQGHRKSRILSEALDIVRRKAFFLKILGSYPRAHRPRSK